MWPTGRSFDRREEDGSSVVQLGLGIDSGGSRHQEGGDSHGESVLKLA